MQFRKNINALRAIAVISVVLFHFKVSGFSGGFAGVDIFFVISGYLMTGIIFSGLREQRFSLIGFYAARARRIIPALAILCLALLVFGFIFLPLDDYRDTIRTIKSSLLFSSNFDFAKSGNYFDAPLHENWLLHTWSLSVEWQFYLIYPLLLMAIGKYLSLQKAKWVLLLTAAASLVASAIVTQTHPVFAFYMLPTRAWEMIAGGLVFLFPLHLSKRHGQVFELLGLGLILGSVLGFSEGDLWPGYLALVPVLGTVLVIYGNTQSLFSNNKFLQFFGSTSYSTYLWHWPIVVFLYTCGLLIQREAVVFAIVLSFVLGALSYYLVESKIRKSTSARSTLLKYAGVTVALVAVSAITASVVKDYPQVRFAFVDLGQPQYTSKLYTQECSPNDYSAATCKFGSGRVSVILFGDSHAQSTGAAVQLENKQAAISWARGGCPTLQHFEMRDKKQQSQCLGFNNEFLTRLKEEYHGVPVILFSRAAMYSDTNRDNSYRAFFNGNERQDQAAFARDYMAEYSRTVCSIAKDHPVYIVKPIPEMPFSVYKGLNLHTRIFGRTSDISTSLEDYQRRNHLAIQAIEVAAQACNAQVLDPTPYLCPHGRCMGSQDGVPLYFDDNHLVDSGNQLLRGLFKGLIKDS